MNKIKTFIYRTLLAVFAVLIVFTTCFSTVQLASATYYGVNKYDTAKLELMRMYWRAAEKCVGSSKMQSVEIKLVNDDNRLKNNDKVKSYYNLNSSYLFDNGAGSGNSNLLYSEYLEKEITGKHDDGKLWCSEINIFPILLEELDIYTDEMRNNLICNGREPGMFKISAGFFITNGQISGSLNSVWPVDWPMSRTDGAYINNDDCIGNLEKLIEYVEKYKDVDLGYASSTYRGMKYAFTVKIEPSDNIKQYFINKIKPYVQTVQEIMGEDYTNDVAAMDYWQYRNNFEIGCLGKSISSGSITPPPPSAQNKIGVYDVVTGYMYYYNSNDFKGDDKQYLYVDNAGQLTCRELANKLSKPYFVDYGGNLVYYAQIMSRDSMRKCITDYKTELEKLSDRIEDYKKIQVYADGLKKSINEKIQNIKDGAFPADFDHAFNEYVYFDKTNYINTLDTIYYARIHAGIDGKLVYNDDLLNTLISAYKDILNNTIIGDDKKTIVEKPDDAAINDFEKLLGQWKDEIARIDREIFSAETYYNEHKDWPNKDVDDVKGELWDIEEQKTAESEKYVPVCFGITTLQNETEDLFSAAPPDINVSDWTYKPVSGMPDISGSTYTEAKSCLNSGGAQSLGWLLCPILDVVSGAAKTIYNDMLEPALQIDPALFTENGANSGTRTGWEYFRNFANILFVIFLLIVIFSQLTGYGIDNYGIKKILPKLIVVAVLINLSYFICIALVDISNILGNSLREMFMSMNAGPAQTLDAWGKVESGVNTIAVTALITVVAGGVIWMAIESGGAMMILIGLLMGVISVLIAFLFLFILLAAREMAIVVLVIISPLAVVCYALPNTKNLFDKYKKLGQSLLLVYPIAGLLVGGGDYVSRLMLSNGAGGGFATGLAAMLAGIIPVFFIPSVLKGSLDMMGQLGTKISGFGKNMGAKYKGNLDRGIKSTDRYKNYQDMRMRDKKLNEAARVRRRIGGIPEAERTQKQKERLMDADRTVNEYTQRAADARVGVTPITPTIAQQRAQTSVQAQEFKNYSDRNSQLTRGGMEDELRGAVAAFDNDRSDTNATRLMAALAEAERKGMHKELLAASTGLTRLNLRGENGTDARVLGQLSGSGNRVLSQYAKSRIKNSTRTMSLEEFTRGTSSAGGINVGDNLQEAFAAKGADVLQGMNDDTLEYLNNANSGALSTEQLVSAAMHTSDEKELTQINAMLSGRNDYRMKATDLANITNSTLNALDYAVYHDAAMELSDGSEASRKIIQNMRQEVRDSLVANGYTAFGKTTSTPLTPTPPTPVPPTPAPPAP